MKKINTTCWYCGTTFIPLSGSQAYCGRCKETVDILSRVFNALWIEYKLDAVLESWRGSSLSQETIIIHKCAYALPGTLIFPFRSTYEALNKYRPGFGKF
jgi:hypothetical protein